MCSHASIVVLEHCAVYRSLLRAATMRSVKLDLKNSRQTGTLQRPQGANSPQHHASLLLTCHQCL